MGELWVVSPVIEAWRYFCYVTHTPLAIPQSFMKVGLVLLELTLIELAVEASHDFMAERGTEEQEEPSTGIY